MKIKIFIIIILVLAVIGAFIGGKSYKKAEASGSLPKLSYLFGSLKNSISPKVEEPLRLSIPKIGVDAEIEYVGTLPDGSMDVPKNEDNVGWWMHGVKPGDVGNAVIDGHIDRQSGGPAVFYKLSSLNINDDMSITDRKGKVYTFKVKKKEVYKDESFPVNEVFGKAEGKHLILITCTGYFDRTKKNYTDRMVIYSDLDYTN